MAEDDIEDFGQIAEDYAESMKRREKPEDMKDIYYMVLTPEGKSSLRYKPIIEERTTINPRTKKEEVIPVIVDYKPYIVPFRERHTIDKTSSNISKQERGLLAIDGQLCTLFQALTIEFDIDMRISYDYFFENSTEYLNLSKSVEQSAIAGLRTTRTYQEGKVESRQQQLMEQEKKGFWGFLRR